MKLGVVLVSLIACALVAVSPHAALAQARPGGRGADAAGAGVAGAVGGRARSR